MKVFAEREIESIIKYTFKDKNLLKRAFTHSSYANENSQQDNELMEFFGDSIIGFVVTENLYNKGNGDEGGMTVTRSELVSKIPLNKALFALGLEKYILLGQGQKRRINKQDKLYSSVYEALVCALYLDGGIVVAKRFVKNTLIKPFEKQAKTQPEKCAWGACKSQFQEYVQKNKLGDIKYQLVKKIGPDHSAQFISALYLNGKKLAEGQGSSIKNSQAQAAEKALKIIKKQDGINIEL